MRRFLGRLALCLSGFWAMCASAATMVSIGADNGFHWVPFYTTYQQFRMTVVVLASEMSGAGSISSLALNVYVVPGETLENWTIRIKHTTRTNYDTGSFEATGWTTVYQANETVSEAGWHTFTFSTPFAYNGTDNLLVDFSRANSGTYANGGWCRVSTYDSPTRAIVGAGDGSQPDPLTWSSTVGTPGSSFQVIPMLRLGVEATGPVEGYALSQPLDTNPGWTTTGQWAFGTPTGGGGTSHGKPDPTSGYTGSKVYGVNLAGDYSTTVGGPYYLTTPAIDCRGFTGLELRFRSWLNTDIPNYVPVTLAVSNNGSTWTQLYTNAGEVANNSWQLMTYNVSAVADGKATVYLRWSYQVIKSGAWAYSGWNIDDIQLVGTTAGAPETEVVIGTGTATLEYPLNTAAHDSRLQSIYLAGNIGVSGSIKSLSLNVQTVPGQTLNNWTIRMRHTTLTANNVYGFLDSGWTTVYQGNEPPGTAGWRTFTFAAPFYYDGSNNLMIDFSHNNASSSTAGRCYVTSLDTSYRSCHGSSNSADGDPLSWAAAGPAGSLLNTAVPNIKLAILNSANPAPTVTAITPGTAVNTGTVSVTNLAGTSFLAGASVKLTKTGQTPITATGVTVVSATKITCTFDLAGAATGNWDVVVTNPDAKSGTRTGGFAVTAPPPTVAAITPGTGANNGTVDVTNLAGTGFLAGASVKLTKTGQTAITATGVTVASATKITCAFNLAGAATGAWNVVVTNPDAQSGTLANGFAVISSAQALVTVGTGTSPLSFPMYTERHDARSQVIYLASEIGTSGKITALGLDVKSVPGQDMANWTIRIKHTALSGYSTFNFETDGWTTVYQGDEPVGATGWRMFTFGTPFPYDGISNLLVDFSFNNSSAVIWSGDCFVSSPGGVRMQYGYSNSTAGNPLDWSGSVPSPYVGQSSSVPNIKLLFNGDAAPTATAISPATAPNTGSVAITNLAGTGFVAGASVRLTKLGQADIVATGVTVVSPTQITGTFDLTGAATGAWDVVVANPDFQSATLAGEFTVAPPIIVTLPSSATEGDGVLAGAGSVGVPIAPNTDLTVYLASDDAGELTVPASVVIAAGTTAADFDLTIVDDSDLDGTRTATVTATADGHSPGSATMDVLDNETAVLAVGIPATATEGDGILANQGTVTANAAPTADITVALASDDTSEVTVPASVVIPAGQTSATFSLTVVDDNAIDGTRTATVTAQVPGWTAGSASIDILDNETMDLAVILPATAAEGDGTLANAGTVGISGTLTADLTVSLLSQDTSEATVPATVVIAAGATSATFDITIDDDDETDGTQTVGITASADGFTQGSDTIEVKDNDVDHFVWAAVASPQQAGVAFGVTVTAKDVDGLTLAPYTGTAALAAAGDAGNAALSVTTTGAFTNGVWTGSLSVNAVDTNVVLTATDGAAGGDSNAFGVNAGALDRFVWNTVSSPQYKDSPFAVTVAAVDASGYTVTDFADTVSLAGMVGSGSSGEVSAGTADGTGYTPLYTYYPIARSQHLYMASELGDAKTITAIAAHISTVSGTLPFTMPNFTIRLGHTTSTSMPSTWLPASSLTIVYKHDTQVSAAGWITFELDTPFEYNGTDNLFFDWSFRGTSTIGTTCYWTRTIFSPQRTLYGTTSDAGAADPLTWSGTAPFAGSLNAFRADLRFAYSISTSVILSPTQSGAFTAGVWTGQLTIGEVVEDVHLSAADGNGHTGDSNNFDVEDAIPLTVTLPASATEGDGVLAGAGSVSVPIAPNTDLTVYLASDDAGELTVPASVVIAAGTTFATFDLTIVDDSDLDGTRTATVTATATTCAPGSATMDVLDNETAVLAVGIPATATEGDGILANQGTVSVPVAPTFDVTVTLGSDDTSEVTVPASVVIPSGQTSATFSLTVVDDNAIDGTRTATVTAQVPGWTAGSDSIDILDNETTNLTVTLPATATEGDGTLANAGTVGISGTLTTDLTVSLLSQDTSEATVPATVVIAAGTTSATFDITIVDDDETDGTRTVGITASADGFTDDSGTFDVKDNDVDHFVWAAVASPQQAGVAFGVTVTAKDVDGLTLASYTGPAALAAAGDAGNAALSVTTTGAFTNGVWTGSLSVNAVDTNVVLTATDGAAGGDSDAFDIEAGPLDHFSWSTVSSPQYKDNPFAVTVTARDANGYTATDFTGTVGLAAMVGWGTAQSTVGTGANSSFTPFLTYYATMRSQQFYYASELGGAKRITAVALEVASTSATPPFTIPGLTIRMCHSSASSMPSGWLAAASLATVYHGELTITGAGWVTIQLDAPFDYNGAENLFMDVSIYTTTDPGKYPYWMCTSLSPACTYYKYLSGTSNGDPLAWSGTTPVSGSTNAYRTNLRLTYETSTPVALSPTQSGAFTAGVWTGQLTIGEVVEDVHLSAADGNGHTGDSNNFDVEDAIPLTVTLPASATEGDGVLAGAGSVGVPIAPNTDLTVYLASDDASELTVPASVVIAAGTTFADFDLTIVDDSDLDGTRTATVTATATACAPGSATMDVLDNETTVLAVGIPATATEGDGILANQGTVSVPVAPTFDVTVTLGSDDTSEVTVPASVVIPSGQTSATFSLTVVDDNAIDGTRTATVTAQVPGWTAGSASIDILDNETTDLAVTLPATAAEGDGTLANAGTVGISGTLAADLTVSLLSQDTSEATVPATVVIAAGATSATFDIAIVDDDETDGTQTVGITASADGFTQGSDTIEVKDNDAHHFTFDAIGSQVAGEPFAATIRARDVNGKPLVAFTGTVELSAAGDGGILTISPAAATAFAAGVWAGNLTITENDARAVLTADDGTGHTGQSNTFLVFGENEGEIRGRVWNDADGDAVRSGEEGDLPNWKVYLDLNESGAWDPGEPCAWSGADGSYSILAPPGVYAVAEVVEDNFWRTFPQNLPSSEPLSFVQLQRQPVNGVDGINGANDVAVSPDGKHVYCLGLTGWSIGGFERNPDDGTLVFRQALINGTGSLDALRSPASIAISPDGCYVYVSATGLNAVSVFSRNDSTGFLSYRSMAKNGSGGVLNLSSPRGIAMSPDGAHVYATSDSNAVVVFSRDATTGALAYVGSQVDAVLLKNARQVQVSPDGRNIYVVGSPTSALGYLTVFDRNPTTGLLTYRQEFHDDDAGLPLFARPYAVAISSDGTSVYVACYDDDSLHVFSRDPSTGLLDYLEAHTDGVGAVDGLDGVKAVVVSRDGRQVFAASATDGLSVFSRNRATGALVWQQVLKDNPAAGDGLAGAAAITTGPGDIGVYCAATNESCLSLFARHLPQNGTHSVLVVRHSTLSDCNFGNQPYTLTLSLPADAVEGAVLAGTGTVSIARPLDADLVVGLGSSDPEEITVPSTVVIPTGQTSAAFDLVVVDDDRRDGTQVVVVTATAAGWLQGVAQISVRDNDPDHFAWAAVPSPQYGGVAFAVTITAQDSTNATVTGFTGSVLVSATAGGETLPLSEATTGAFVAGVWTGSIAVNALADDVRLTAAGMGATGVSGPFNVTFGSLDHFEWEVVPSPQYEGYPFTATFTAKDANGYTLDNYAGTVNLRVYSLFPQSGTIHGNRDWSNRYSNSTTYEHQGISFTPSKDLPVTHLRHCFGTHVNIFRESDQTLLLSQPVSGTPGVWTETPVDTPITLLKNTAYRIAARVPVGEYYYTYSPYTPFAVTDGTVNAGVWCTTTDPEAVACYPQFTLGLVSLVGIRYTRTPTYWEQGSTPKTATLENGMWTGSILMHDMLLNAGGTDTVVRADNGTGAMGDSGSFLVFAEPPVTVTIPEHIAEDGGTLVGQGTVSLIAAVAENLEVALTCNHPAILSVPPTVTIVAGQSSATFDLAPVDNATFDGPRTVTVTASAPERTNGSATAQILDDEVAPAFTESSPATVVMDEDGDPTPFALTLHATDGNGDTLTWSIQTQATHGVATVSGTGTSKTIDYAPPAEWSGNDSFVVKVDDGTGGTATITVDVTVNPVDDAPTVANPIDDVTVDEDAPDMQVSLANVFTDIDNDDAAIVKTAASGDPGLVTVAVEGDTLTLGFQPDANGTCTVTVTATSNGKTVDGVFTVTVNPVDDAPTVANPLADIVVDEDAADVQVSLATTFTDIDDDDAAIAKTASSGDPGLVTVAVDGDTLTLHLLPDANGTCTVTVTATSNGKTVEDVFMVTVNPVNDAPAFSLSGDVTVDEDFAAARTVTVTPGPVPADEAEQTVVYSLSPATVGFATVAIDGATGQVTITAITAAATQLFTVTADDGQAANNTATATFTLTIVAKNADTFTVADISPATYDGTAHTPEPEVRDGGTVLVKNTDYTLSYAGNTNAGTATVTVTGTGNYTGTQDKTFEIGKATLTVTPAAGQSKTFGEDDPAFAYTHTGEVEGETPLFTGALARDPGEDAGEYDILVGTLALADNAPFLAANYTLAFTDGVVFAINPKNAGTFTVADIAPATYDGTAHTPEPEVRDGGTVLVKNTDYTLSYAGNTNAGTATVTVTGTGNYTGTQDKTFEIGKATLTVTPAAGQSKTFGEDDPAFAYTHTGEVEGETPLFTGALSRAPGEDAGAYELLIGTLALADNAPFLASNYTLEFTPGVVFTIGKATSTVAATGGTAYTYTGIGQGPDTADTTGSNGAVTFSYSGTGETVYGPNVGKPADAGTYQVVATVAADANHDGAVSAPLAFAIGKAALTVIPDAGQSKTFGGDDPELAYGHSGAVVGETPEFTGTLSRAAGETVGDYAILAGTLALTDNAPFLAANYELAFTPGVAFAINPKNAGTFTVADIAPATYDGTDHTPEPEVRDGGTVLVKNTDYTLSYAGNTNAGTATVTVTGTGNYTGTQDKTFEIGKATLTVTPAAGQSKTFGEDDPAFAYTHTGEVEGETPLFTGALSRDPGEDAGQYDILAGTLALVDNVPFLASNYTIQFTPGVVFAINPKNAGTFTVADLAPATYDGTAHTPEPEVRDGGMLLVKDADYTLAYADNTNAGTATVTVTGTGNYTGTQHKEFEIRKRTLTVTADNKAKVYDGEIYPVAAYSVSYAGFVAGENEAVLGGELAYAGSAIDAKNAGRYAITPFGLASGNYAFGYVDGILIIAEAEQTIVFDPLPAKAYGDAPFALDATATSGLPVSFSSSDETVATVSGTTVTIVGPGETTITASQAGDGNWNPAPAVTRVLVVGQPVLTVVHGSGGGPHPAGAEVPVAADTRAGRTFVGWTVEPPEHAANLADATAIDTTFTMPGGNAVLTATYEFNDPAWTVGLTVAGALPETLTFGMHAAAEATLVEGLDAAGAELPLLPGQATLVSDDLSQSYSTQFRAPAATAEFLLVARAGAQPATVSWNLSALPEGKFLSVYEVLLDGVARTLVGNTALDMAASASLEVPAGETRCYVIRYGDELVFDLAFARGWNLVSLPVEPLDPAVDAVLENGTRQGRVCAESVLGWTGADYAECDSMHACAGYWVHADEPEVLLVRGLPVQQEFLSLRQGMNLLGPAKLCPVPADSRIRGVVWVWNAPLLRYQAVDCLQPGCGHWINASEDAQIPFPAEDR